MSERIRFRVIPTEDGLALKNLLGRRLQRGQSDVARLIKAGGVYVNELRIRIPGVRVAKGERITVYPGAGEVARLPADTLRFVHREPAFCVIDKPHGVPAESTRESSLGTVSEALLRLLAEAGVTRPYVGVVHALDPAAAGLIMFSTRGLADANLHRRLASHPVRRTYRFATHGGGEPVAFVDRPLVATRHGELRLPRPGEEGAPASTRFEPVAERGEYRLLQATLVDAPARQALLHARAAGRPVIGDEDGTTPLRLWCARMELAHPATGAPMDLRSRAPSWAEPESTD